MEPGSFKWQPVKISTLGDLQKLPGKGPGQCVLSEPAWPETLDKMTSSTDVTSNISHSVNQFQFLPKRYYYSNALQVASSF